MTWRPSVPRRWPLLGGAGLAGAALPVLAAVLTQSAGWTLLMTLAVVGGGIVTASLASEPTVRAAGLALIAGVLVMGVGAVAVGTYSLRDVKF